MTAISDSGPPGPASKVTDCECCQAVCVAEKTNVQDGVVVRVVRLCRLQQDSPRLYLNVVPSEENAIAGVRPFPRASLDSLQTLSDGESFSSLGLSREAWMRQLPEGDDSSTDSACLHGLRLDGDEISSECDTQALNNVLERALNGRVTREKPPGLAETRTDGLSNRGIYPEENDLTDQIAGPGHSKTTQEVKELRASKLDDATPGPREQRAPLSVPEGESPYVPPDAPESSSPRIPRPSAGPYIIPEEDEDAEYSGVYSDVIGDDQLYVTVSSEWDGSACGSCDGSVAEVTGEQSPVPLRPLRPPAEVVIIRGVGSPAQVNGGPPVAPAEQRGERPGSAKIIVMTSPSATCNIPTRQINVESISKRFSRLSVTCPLCFNRKAAETDSAKPSEGRRELVTAFVMFAMLMGLIAIHASMRD